MKIFTHDAVRTQEHRRALDYLVRLNPSNDWVSLRVLTCWAKQTNAPTHSDESDIGVLFFQLSRGGEPVVCVKQQNGRYFYCLSDDRLLKSEVAPQPLVPSLVTAESLLQEFSTELKEKKERISRRRARARASAPSWETPTERVVSLPDDF